MTDKAQMLALAERVEALSGPDREVDDTIAAALFTGKHRVCVKGLSDEAGGMWMFTYPDGSIGSALRFTASLDAAMTLVPDYAKDDWSLIGGRHWQAIVGPNEDQADAATPALALCAAALRAIAEGEEG